MKRRRLDLKDARRQHHAAAEVREGTQYQSECGFLPSMDTTEISAPVPFQPLPSAAENKYVFFDLETTGSDEITQIAAVCGDQSFSRYVSFKMSLSKVYKEFGMTLLCLHVCSTAYHT